MPVSTPTDTRRNLLKEIYVAEAGNYPQEVGRNVEPRPAPKHPVTVRTNILIVTG